MPMHDWTRVTAGTYHDFHYDWISVIKRRLNAGLLPPGYLAMAEQMLGGVEPDVVGLRKRDTDDAGLIATLIRPPKARKVAESAKQRFAAKANRIAIHHKAGDVVAVIELVSPGNKSSRRRFDQFVANAADLLDLGVNLLIVDPFPPTRRDPNGIHRAIWDEIAGEGDSFVYSTQKPLTLASYTAQPPTAYVEAIAVGDSLPDMPLFLDWQHHVEVPLEECYQETWNLQGTGFREFFDIHDPQT